MLLRSQYRDILRTFRNLSKLFLELRSLALTSLLCLLRGPSYSSWSSSIVNRICTLILALGVLSHPLSLLFLLLREYELPSELFVEFLLSLYSVDIEIGCDYIKGLGYVEGVNMIKEVVSIGAGQKWRMNVQELEQDY